MVGGTGYVPVQNEVNMALAPRQTGSSIKLFILAAALQAGVQPTDLIDGTSAVHAAEPGRPEGPVHDHQRRVPAASSPLAEQTWLSINCAFARADPDRRAAPRRRHHLPDGPVAVPVPRARPTAKRARRSQPYASFATGANAMAPIDMAVGMQTIANQGLHHEPYYVEHDRPGRRHVGSTPTRIAGTQVLDPGVALTELSTC